MNYTIIAQLSSLKMIGMDIVHGNPSKIPNSSVIKLIKLSLFHYVTAAMGPHKSVQSNVPNAIETETIVR